jgi:DNA (cytosine-5)-methyltransferase 1
MTSPIPVIDLFAGPGGLNEGFSSVQNPDGTPFFETIGSFEMESNAVRTLTLREMFRLLGRGTTVPKSYYAFIRGEITWSAFLSDNRVSEAHEIAAARVHEVELGSHDDPSDELIQKSLEEAGALDGKPWVLIGGPPCQAYSLAGRSRRANDKSFAEDKKHFLYREYLRIIRTFAPSVFVMENVKGLLSSTTSGESMFDLIKRDLEKPGGHYEYEIHSLVSSKHPGELLPTDFIIRAEQYGVPQKRHRVILLGIRKDFVSRASNIRKLAPSMPVTVETALAGIPALRSGISPKHLDDSDSWLKIREERVWPGSVAKQERLGRGGPSMLREGVPPHDPFADWIVDPELKYVVQHETRAHMSADLRRYRFAAIEADRSNSSPKLSGFPPELQPNHRNASALGRPFEDRFRVQLRDAPSTTIVSHISKDGHYYIHPDPDQMRSLTVREAARLQTFPDNYYFMGNRTQQYHQVGNAVPPYLARQIADAVTALFNE